MQSLFLTAVKTIMRKSVFTVWLERTVNGMSDLTMTKQIYQVPSDTGVCTFVLYIEYKNNIRTHINFKRHLFEELYA